jgi:glutamine synthetase
VIQAYNPPVSVHEHDIRPLVRSIGTPPEQWRRADIEAECLNRGIRVLNLRYASLDGKLRELRVPVRSRRQLTRVLAGGERVDGSSLFPGMFPTSASDLYAVPVYRWTFLDPWAPDEMHLVCRFLDASGNPCADTPDTALETIAARLRARGNDLYGLAELEFYILGDHDHDRFSARVQRNYHQGTPFLHQRAVADDILRVAAATIGHVKYCHAEVGYIDRLQSEDPEIDGRRGEQYELELDLMPIEDLGTWLTVARWLVRTIADRHGASVTFVPKLDEGMAGNGMHLHLAVISKGVNLMNEGGELSKVALGTIGGLIRHVPSLAAFGNTVASSFLRLVPGQEAPTRVAWGHRNRGGVIRVPLGFSTPHRLDQTVNPDEDGEYPDDLARPTVELRLPDGSAFPQPLVAAVAAAVEDGLDDPSAIELARKSEMADGGAEPSQVDPEHRIPTTVLEAAAALVADRKFYVKAGLSDRLLDRIVERLQSEGDLGGRLDELPPAERLVESRRLMHKDLHKH